MKMEQKRRGLGKWFASLHMSGKIMLSAGALILCSNLLILLIVCSTAVSSLRAKTSSRTQDHLTTSLSTVGSTIDDIANLMIMMTTIADISDYVNEEVESQVDYLQIVNGVNEELRLLKQSYAVIDYVALIRVNGTNPLYLGREMTYTDTYNRLLEGTTGATALKTSGVFIGLMTGVYDEAELNLYCPVYEKYSIGEEPRAWLVVGIGTDELYALIEPESSTTALRLINGEGVITLSADQTEIGTAAEVIGDPNGTQGEWETGDRMTAWSMSSDRMWIAEASFSRQEVLGDIWMTARVMAMVILLFTLLAIVVVYRLCEKVFAPMEEMQHVMDRVTDGDLDVRMKEYQGEDLNRISRTFNSMTISLKEQMEMIRRKEQENTEIRLNALQSQIKPHFPYNTLECIHWQALLEGAQEASKMIMALSRFYRLSLSKGAELVPLSAELEHTRSYILIQNIRFDDILEMEYDIAPDAERMEIPKITLQPLIENAIYHGIKPVEDRKGHVRVTAEIEDGWLILMVEDDGIGMSEEAIDALNANIGVLVNDGSYGVKNVHTRLAIRYGEGSGLHYEKNRQGGITVTVRLPARPAVQPVR